MEPVRPGTADISRHGKILADIQIDLYAGGPAGIVGYSIGIPRYLFATALG